MIIEHNYSADLKALRNKIKSKKSLLDDIRSRSWALSKAAAENPAKLQHLRGKITKLNQLIRKKYNQPNFIVTVPQSAYWTSKATLPFRVLSIVLRLVPTLILYAIGSLFFKDLSMDPKTITNSKTPILFIHGSGACQRQWDFFRKFATGDDIGHSFSLNLNDSAFFNDKMSIEDYANKKIAAKIEKMRKQYEEAGYRMDQVILVGHSMGGLVGGAYATEVESKVKVKALIAMSSPWYGSPLAKRFLNENMAPEKAFLPNCKETTKLREAVIEKASKGKMGLYTFNSSLDPMVPVSSSSLPIAPSHQIYHTYHDHYTSMLDPYLVARICKWIAPHTSSLIPIDRSQKYSRGLFFEHSFLPPFSLRDIFRYFLLV